MAKLDICTECDLPVQIDDDDVPYVEDDGTTMHASCYEEMKSRELPSEKATA